MCIFKSLCLKAGFVILGMALSGSAFAIEHSETRPTIRVGVTFLTRGLDPVKGSNGWALVSHGIGETLFTVNKAGNLVPQLADKATRLDDFTWSITLRKGRRFSDGSDVTAAALAAGFSRTIKENKVALATGGKLVFSADDPLTLKVKTEKPVSRIQTLFAEWPMIAFKPEADGRSVFSGPYAAESFKADHSLTLVPNAYFGGAKKRSPVDILKFGDAQSMALALESGDIDLAFGLPPEMISRLTSNDDLTIKSFPVGYQYFAWFNTTRPALADVRVRQALDRAFDRHELIAALNGGQPATGAYAPYFPFAGKKARPTNVSQAQKLLDDAGWIKGATGVRKKDGHPLTLLALTYPQRPDLVTMLPVIKAELAEIGVQLQIRIVNTISQVVAKGDYDIALWAQHTAPAGDPAFFLNSMLRSGASMNYARYASKQFDALIDDFATESRAEKRNAIALAAQAKLFEDVPISFLVSPVWYVGLSKRLRRYQPWGSDYHVLRAAIGEAP